MRRIFLALTILIAGATVTLTLPPPFALAHGPERVSHQDFPPRPGGTPFVIGLPNLNPPTATAVPSGSPVHNPPKPRGPQDAVRVALTNRYVEALLKGKPYRIQKVGPWSSTRGKLIVVAFYRATTVSGTWLALGKPAYHATYGKVIGIAIYVEVTHNSVAAIKPRFRPG